MSSSSDARSRAVQAALQRQAGPISPVLTSPTSTSSNSSPFSSSTDPLRSLILFVVGAPGAGKTTQCAALASSLSFHHVQFDDFFHQALRHAEDKARTKRASTTSAAPSASSSARSSLSSSASGFVPTLSSSQLSSLLRSHQTKQPIPSSIRARLLYSAMQHLSHSSPLFRFLVDGYLDSEDDWNEWASLVKKRQAEGNVPSLSTSSSITFLPPIIIRLVCSESVGQLRWRRQQLLDHDHLTANPHSSTSDVKARSMKYSLRTRPLIYRLGMVAEEKAWHDAAGDDDDEDDPDALATMDGMIVKRVDAEGTIDACYQDMEGLVKAIIAHTQDDDWTRITGYDSDQGEEDAVAGVPLAAGAKSVLSSAAAAATSSATSGLTIRPPESTPVPALATPTLPTIPSTLPPPATTTTTSLEAPPSPLPAEADSPGAINWQEDPQEAREREEAEREELDRLERTQRMLRLIEAEELKWAEEAEREEAREKRRMEEEIARLREREELVEAEQGHIRTRRDDRFTTFISTILAVSIVQGVKEGDGLVWVEVYRGVGGEGAGAGVGVVQPVRWLRVAQTARLPVTSLSIAFPRFIVNTWRLSGNERERPVMFRLFYSAPPSTNIRAPTIPPTLIGESRTMLQHLLAPPEEKGLTLTLRSPSGGHPASPAPLAYLLISPASLHTLLKPHKIIPPHRLHTVMADRVIIPAQIPLTPSNAVSPAGSRGPTPPDTPKAGAGAGSKRDEEEKGEEKVVEREEEKERSSRKEGGKDRTRKESRHREHKGERRGTRSDSELKGEPRRAADGKKGEGKEEDEELERVLREMDQQIGVSSKAQRRHSFHAQSTGDVGQKGAATGKADQPAEGGRAKGQDTGRRSIVEQARAALGRLSIQAQAAVGGGGGGKESRVERERRELLEARKKRKREEAKELARRAASRERRRRELARIKKRAQVQKVSALTVDCGAANLPKQGLLSEGRFYLQVYRRRDRVKEKERAIKVQRQQQRLSQSSPPSTSPPVPSSIPASSIHTPSVKLQDEAPPLSRNWCIHPSHRHLIKPSLYSLVHTSPVSSSTTSPSFPPFLLPLDDQPLLLVLLSTSSSHRHDVVGERQSAHEGKDKVVGLVRLQVEDVVKMAVIQQREWDVDVHALVEREREKERRRERKAREVEKRRARGEQVDDSWEQDEDREEDQVQRLTADKHRVSVLLKTPAQLDSDRAARKAKREAKRRKAGAAPVPVKGGVARVGQEGDEDEEDSSDDDSDEEGEEQGESAGGVVLAGAAMLHFFELAFFTTRPVRKEDVDTADYTQQQTQRTARRPTSGSIATAQPATRGGAGGGGGGGATVATRSAQLSIAGPAHQG